MGNQHVTLNKTEQLFLKEIWTQIENGADGDTEFWSFAKGYLIGAHPSWEPLAHETVIMELEQLVEAWLDEYYV